MFKFFVASRWFTDFQYSAAAATAAAALSVYTPTTSAPHNLQSSTAWGAGMCLSGLPYALYYKVVTFFICSEHISSSFN